MVQSNRLNISFLTSLSQNELVKLYKELQDEANVNIETLKCINFLIKKSCKG